MRLRLSILCIFMLAFAASAQILPADNDTIQKNKFRIYIEHTDSLTGIHYQVGTYNPADKPEIYLPIYLRVAGQGFENYYFLNTKYDPDLFSFEEPSPGKIVVIKGRYQFYVYDIRRQTLSRKLRPGLGQYEGDDGISGLIGAITLFDDHFLVGNVKNFGVFCYDVSNPANPTELLQYVLKNANEERRLNAFFYKTTAGLFDMLSAASDVSGESHVSAVPENLRSVHYMQRNIALDLDSSKFSIPQPYTGTRYLSETYFTKISPIQTHTSTGETEEFCNREEYVYENGVRYSITDYGPCEQCGRSVAETFIPNFNTAQGFMLLLVLYGSLDLEEIVLEHFTVSEIRFSWRFSAISIIPHEGGVRIVEDIML